LGRGESEGHQGFVSCVNPIGVCVISTSLMDSTGRA
jgi:hypothetical protein